MSPLTEEHHQKSVAAERTLRKRNQLIGGVLFGAFGVAFGLIVGVDVTVNLLGCAACGVGLGVVVGTCLPIDAFWEWFWQQLKW